jgi:hypothetical protein
MAAHSYGGAPFLAHISATHRFNCMHLSRLNGSFLVVQANGDSTSSRPWAHKSKYAPAGL